MEIFDLGVRSFQCTAMTDNDAVMVVMDCFSRKHGRERKKKQTVGRLEVSDGVVA